MLATVSLNPNLAPPLRINVTAGRGRAEPVGHVPYYDGIAGMEAVPPCNIRALDPHGSW